MADSSAVNMSAVISGASATVDRVFLSGSLSKMWLKVLNVDGGGRISFRVDGTAAVQDAAENFCVPAVANASVMLPVVEELGGQLMVSLIFSANCKYQCSLVPAPLGR